MRFLIVSMIAALMVTGPAAAALVDFEPVPAAGNPILTGSTDIQGLTFTSSHYHVIGSIVGSFGGNVAPVQYLGVDAPGLGAPVTVTRTGGGIFTITALDGSKLWGSDAAAEAGGFNNADLLHLVGNLNGGGTVTVDLPLAFGFAGFALVGFTNLDSVVISGIDIGKTDNASWAVDNIVWSEQVIPEPSSLLLVGGAGLLALALRRKG